MRKTHVRLNHVAIMALAGDRRAVGQALNRAGEIVEKGAKGRAPTSPHGSEGRPSGYLRSSIHHTLEEDEKGLFARIGSEAYTDAGFNYGLAQEIGTSKMEAQPHLRPALDDLKGKKL